MNQRGHTITELMVSLALAGVIVTTALKIFVGQSHAINASTQRDSATQEAHLALERVSRLLRQAQIDSMQINVVSGGLNANDQPERAQDSLSIEFLLPSGFAIWPNNKNAPAYDKNKVRLSWNNLNSDNTAIYIENGSPDENLGTSNARAITGTLGPNDPPIINFDVWPIDAQGNPLTLANVNANAMSGLLVRVTTRSAKPDFSYQNPLVSEGQLQNYRTYSASAIVVPRN